MLASRKLWRSIFPSSNSSAWRGTLSLKYQTGCWLFFTATCSSELGGPGRTFWNSTIGRSVVADDPGCSGGTCEREDE